MTGTPSGWYCAEPHLPHQALPDEYVEGFITILLGEPLQIAVHLETPARQDQSEPHPYYCEPIQKLVHEKDVSLLRPTKDNQATQCRRPLWPQEMSLIP
jgi:hypothetical protein